MSRVEAGFTLVELIVTIAIAAILMAIAVPGMQGYLAKSRLDRIAGFVQADAAFARGEALRRQRGVSICPADIRPNMTGSISCDAGGDWSKGWVVFVDPSNAGVIGAIDDQGEVLRVRETTANATVTPEGDLAGVSFIRFLPSGVSSVSGRFHVCSVGTSRGADVSLVRGGRVSRTDGAC